MRSATILLGLALASPLLAQQIPLPAFGNTYSYTGHTRGFWFQAPVNFVITGARVPDESLQGTQNVEIIDLGLAPPPAYPGLVTGTQLFYATNQPSANILACAVPCVAGNYYGVLGACGTTVMNNSYATPAGPFTSSVLGNPLTLTRFGTQFNINAAGNNPCWQEASGSLSRVEIYVGAAQGYASATPYGTGCYNVAGTSFYENFATPAHDLANSSMTLLHTGSSFLALPGVTTYLPPSGSAQSLALSDDSEVSVPLSAPLRLGATGSTSTLTICSNGFVSAGSGNGTAFTPTVATFLAAPRTGFWCWHDYNPAVAGSGQVKFEEVAGIAYVTWDGVFDYGTTAGGSTFQFQFDLAAGHVHIVWQNMSGLGNGHLIGFSEGGPSPDPGSMDISAALPGSFVAANFAVSALGHSASARPVLGTTIGIDTTNVPASSPLGATMLSLTEITAGIDLTSLGMPGCWQYVAPISTLVFFPVNNSGSLPFAIPNSAGLAGVTIVSQGACLAPGVNALGALASNGLRLILDLN